MEKEVPASCKKLNRTILKIENSGYQEGLTPSQIAHKLLSNINMDDLNEGQLDFFYGCVMNLKKNVGNDLASQKANHNFEINKMSNANSIPYSSSINSNNSNSSDNSNGSKDADRKIDSITKGDNKKSIAHKYHMNVNDVIDFTDGNGEKELNEMIGLKPIKRQLKEFIVHAMFNKRSHQLGQDDKNISSNNMIFMGNPGTGKTVVARLTGKILFQNHVIKKPLLYECSSKNFISPLVGGSAIAANKAIKRALGGVLFIDEAYELAPSKDSSNTSKGSAISELLRSAENHYNKNPDDDVILILAGYKDKMQNLIAKSNEGLRSRFSHVIDFPDYTDTEMIQILKFMAKKNHRNVDPVNQPDVKNDVIKFIHLARGCGDNSNARTMRNLLSAIDECHQLRLAGNDISKILGFSLPQIDDMSAEDIQNGIIQASKNEKESSNHNN